MLLAGAINVLVETLKGMKEDKDPLFNIESIMTSLNLVSATYQIPTHPIKSFTTAYFKSLFI